MQRIYLACLLIILASCSKEKVTEPDFNVVAEPGTYHVGDEIRFSFSGNPEQIIFYSGLNGNRYEHRNRTQARGRTKMKFTSLGEYLNADTEFELFVSKTLRPPADSLAVVNAAWTNISDRAVFSSGQPNTPSGDIDLTDLANPGELLTFAFRFADKPKPTSASRQSTWTIKEISVDNELDDTTYNIVNMAQNAWSKVSFKNSVNIWTNNATQLRIVGGNYLAAENDDWIISKTFDPFFAKSDNGTVIKDFGAQLSSYSFSYNKPGTYKATFVGENVRPDKVYTVVKELTITILP